jgi:hypothetical protein
MQEPYVTDALGQAGDVAQVFAVAITDPDVCDTNSFHAVPRHVHQGSIALAHAALSLPVFVVSNKGRPNSARRWYSRIRCSSSGGGERSWLLRDRCCV